MITEFENLPDVSGPLSQWVRFFYLCSKLNKYITTVPKGYKTNLVLLYHILRTQQKKLHSNWMNGAPRNDLQRCAPQQLPCIKMALAWKIFSINLLYKSCSEPPPMVPRTSSFYRPEVGNHLPTSPQDMASKRAQYPPKKTKIP